MPEQADHFSIAIARSRLKRCATSPENIFVRIRIIGRPSGLHSDQLGAELIASRLVISICRAKRSPVSQSNRSAHKCDVGCGIDQLGGDADPVVRPSDASFEDIAHTEIAANLLRIY